MSANKINERHGPLHITDSKTYIHVGDHPDDGGMRLLIKHLDELDETVIHHRSHNFHFVVITAKVVVGLPVYEPNRYVLTQHLDNTP